MQDILKVLVVILGFFSLAESRQGWKTSGNGYFVYKASTSFNSTNKLEISGKFSTKANSQNDNVVIAAEDANGTLAFQYAVVKGSGKTTVRHGKFNQYSASNVAGLTSGYLFSFTLTVTQVDAGNGTYRHSVASGLGVGVVTTDSRKWNLDNITLYIGGYRQSINSGVNFEGCLSDFTFQGVNIINTYFQQYPNNTNPVRGSLTVGSFSNTAQTCDDVMSTLAPTSTNPASTNPTTVGSGVVCLEVFSFLILSAFAFMISVL